MADLAAWLAGRGHAVHAFAVEGQGPGVFHPVRAPRALTRGARERALGQALVAAAEESGCDVTVGVRHLPRVDLYWPHGGSHAAALHGRRCASAGRLLPVSEVRARGRHRAFLEMERALVEGGRARRVACVSGLVMRELAAAYAGAIERLVLVPDGVDAERFHPRERERSGARLRAELHLDREMPLLAFSARNPVLKGLPALLGALAGLQELPWRLLVAGPKDPARWARRARAAGIAPDRVRVLAEVEPVALAAASDLVVHPTWRDACGLVVLEALAAGTPVITTARAGAAEAIASEEVGTVLDDPGDIAALRRAIATWLQTLRSGGPDRSAVRAVLGGRERETWLAALEAILLDLAAHPSL